MRSIRTLPRFILTDRIGGALFVGSVALGIADGPFVGVATFFLSYAASATAIELCRAMVLAAGRIAQPPPPSQLAHVSFAPES